jgi:hypothetical protein
MADMLQGISQLNGVERDRFSQAAFDGIPAGGCSGSRTFPQARQVGIDRIQFAYRVVVDKRVPATVPGDLYQTGQLRDAYDFLGTIPAQIPSKNVWMTCIGAVCEDARLRVKGKEGSIVSGPVISASDQTYGQAGWDVGIKYGSGQFSKVPQLITDSCKPNFVKKLAINAHGDAGEVAVNGVDLKSLPIAPAMKASDKDINNRFEDVLTFLDHVMTADGVVLFHGCLAGKSLGGTSLLTQLSFALPGRKIVGFSTVGYTSVEKQKRGGDRCREPGARDTNDFAQSSSEGEIYERYFKSGDWDDLSKLPWQSETSPYAKVALNGAIIRGSDL